VTLKVRRDAPTDAAEPAECQVRFRVEPGGQEVSWPVRIRLYPPLYAPRELSLGVVPRGAEREGEIRLTALPNRAFRVTRVQAERGLVRVTLPDNAQGSAWRVLVTLPAAYEAGTVADRILIETDDPDVPRLIVKVTAEVR
jgi:hypothetical protein